MTGMPFNLQGKKGVFHQLAEISSFSSLVVDKWKSKKKVEQEQEEEEEEEEEEEGSVYNDYCFVNEPTSVLDTRKSPSPPTSTSTLSSSLGGTSSGGGGGTTGSTDTAGVAAVSDNPPSSRTKWQQQDTTSPDPAGTTTATASPTELHPIPTTLDIITGGSGGGGGGAEKCVGGGMEDWESMWPETAASPSQEQSLLRWIMGDAEDPSSGLKHFLQGVGPSAADQFELNNNAGSGFGFVDSGASVGGILEALSCASGAAGSALLNPSFAGGNCPAAASSSSSSSSLSLPTTNLPTNGRFVGSNSIPNPFSSSLSNHAKIAPFSSTSASATATTNPSNPPIFPPSSNSLPLNLHLPVSLYQQQHQQQFELSEEKPQLLNLNPSVTQILINHQQNQPTQNPAFFVPLSSPSYPLHQDQHLLPPQPKRHHPAAIVDPSFQISKQLPFPDTTHHEFCLRKSQNTQQFQHQTQQGFPQQLQLLPNHLHPRPLMAPATAAVAATRAKIIGSDGGNGNEDPLVHNQQHLQHHQQQHHALLDQLLKAAELVETGNLVHARGILARLNHQLSPIGKPLHRAAFYFKEALLLLTNSDAATTTISPPQRISTPFDVFLKIGSYKAFSEISPIVQFANFTCNQVFLEALEGFNSIRIIDFDLGLGGQWASFMQEISLRMGGAPSLKITAITSPSSHDHPLELVLAKDNLTHFASDLGISFVIEILNLDSYDPASWSLALNVSEGEAVAVNLPASPSSYHPSSFPSLLLLVKQLSPKIVVSVERGCDRSDLPFLHSLTSYSVLLESLDAVSTNADTVNKIERFLLQPRIDSTVIRRHSFPEKVPPCRTLFASAAFSPSPFSNFTETQAEWLVKRLRVRGFHVEKRQNSLVLCWHIPQQDLLSVSAWTC